MKRDRGRPFDFEPPLGGLAEDQPESRRDRATARVMRDVVPVDPRTSKLRVSSRAGYSDLSSAAICGPGNPIQGLAPFTYPLERRIRQRLSERAAEGFDPSVIVTAWSESFTSAVLAVDVTPQFDLVALLASGEVVIINAQGERVVTIPSPVPTGFAAVPRVVADEFGGITFGASVGAPVEGGSGRLFRFIRDERDVWIKDSELSTEGQLVSFDAQLDDLVTIERPLAGDDLDRDQLVRYAGLLGSPVETLRRAVAWPALHVVLDPFGNALVSSPPNVQRGDPSSAFTDRGVSWTPREIADWQTRLYSWVDGARPAAGLEGLATGDTIAELDDVRFRESGFGVTSDPTERALIRDWRRVYPAPKWDAEAFGGLGATRFQRDASLISRASRDDSDRDLQQALVPTHGDKFALFMVVEIDEAPGALDTPGRLISQGGTNAEFFFQMNQVNDLEVEVADASGPRASQTYTGAARVAILTVVHDGAGSNDSRFRINGEHKANMNFAAILAGGEWDIGGGALVAGARTAVGAHRIFAEHNLAEGITATSAVRTDFRAPVSGTVTRIDWEKALRVMRDGVVVNGDNGANQDQKIQLVAATGFGATNLLVDFGVAVTMSSFAVTVASSNGQVARWRLRASNTDFDTAYVYTEEQSVEFVGGAFPRRQEFILETPTSARYWVLEAVELHAAGASAFWDICEIEWLRREDPFSITALTRYNGASMALGEMLALLDPTEPGAVNGSAAVGAPVADVTDVEAIEGYLAHRFGVAHLLPVDHPYTGAGNVPVGVGDVSVTSEDNGANNSPSGILAKYGPQGTLIAARAGAGYGYGSAVDPDGWVWSIGPRQVSSGAGVWLRRLKDRGVTLGATGEGTQAIEGGLAFEPADRAVGMQVDGCGSVHIPLQRESGDHRYYRVDPDGEIVSNLSLGAAVAPVALALGPDVLTSASGELCGAEWAFIAQVGSEGAVRRLELVGAKDTGEKRTRGSGLATISCGDVYVHDLESGDQLAVAASSVLDARARIASIQAFGKLWLSDGRTSLVFDPRTRALAELRAKGYGRAPSGFGLIELWNGRLCAAALEDDPAAVLTSKQGDPDDWDLFPPVPLQGQAFLLTALDRVGEMPEPVTGLKALSQDVLLVTCETSIYVLAGDPTQGGARDLVSSEIGAPRGEAIAVDSFQRAYILDTTGKVWRYTYPNGLERISTGAVEERLRRTDWVDFAPEMRWNHYGDCLHLRIVPRDLLARDVGHLAFFPRTNAWAEETFIEPDLQPFASAQLDGDRESTRLHVIGCADGFLRMWDRSADFDGGRRIDSEVLIGPWGAPFGSVMARIQDLEVDLAIEQGGAVCELLTSDTADTPGRAVLRWELGTGPNGPHKKAVKGRYFWLRITTGPSGAGWSLKRAGFLAHAAGKRRTRRAGQ